jgi:uncharacterized protein (DUF2164 family)
MKIEIKKLKRKIEKILKKERESLEKEMNDWLNDKHYIMAGEVQAQLWELTTIERKLGYLFEELEERYGGALYKKEVSK